jgi:hypothetical protein
VFFDGAVWQTLYLQEVWQNEIFLI